MLDPKLPTLLLALTLSLGLSACPDDDDDSAVDDDDDATGDDDDVATGDDDDVAGDDDDTTVTDDDDATGDDDDATGDDDDDATAGEGAEYRGGGTEGGFYVVTVDETAQVVAWEETETGTTGSAPFSAGTTPCTWDLAGGGRMVVAHDVLLLQPGPVSESVPLIVTVAAADEPYGAEVGGAWLWGHASGLAGILEVTPGDPETTGTVVSQWTDAGTSADYSWDADHLAVHAVEDESSLQPGAWSYGTFSPDVASFTPFGPGGSPVPTSVAARLVEDLDVDSLAGSYTYLARYGGYGTYSLSTSDGAVSALDAQYWDEDSSGFLSTSLPGSAWTQVSLEGTPVNAFSVALADDTLQIVGTPGVGMIAVRPGAEPSGDLTVALACE